MGDKTGIEWTDATWNPTTGCSKVSQGCKNCYAERDWSRLVHLPAYKGRTFTDVACHPERLEQPLRWAKPRRIFVNSMSDLFHESVPDSFIDEIFAVMAMAQQHVFQVLTKRPERMRDYMNSDCRAPGMADPKWPLPNVWLGVSVEDQETAGERIPILLQTPAAVRWISAEPLLGAIDLSALPHRHGYGASPCSGCGEPVTLNALSGATACGAAACDGPLVDALDWVVVGGESGHNARPMHPQWVRSIRDQCASEGVQFLFKQWGEWLPEYDRDVDDPHWNRCSEVKQSVRVGRWLNLAGGQGFHGEYLKLMAKVGKRHAGRLLDGVLHDGYPENR